MNIIDGRIVIWNWPNLRSIVDEVLLKGVRGSREKVPRRRVHDPRVLRWRRRLHQPLRPSEVRHVDRRERVLTSREPNPRRSDEDVHEALQNKRSRDRRRTRREERGRRGDGRPGQLLRDDVPHEPFERRGNIRDGGSGGLHGQVPRARGLLRRSQKEPKPSQGLHLDFPENKFKKKTIFQRKEFKVSRILKKRHP